MQNPPPGKSLNFQKSKTKCRINKRQRNRRRNKQKSLTSTQNKVSSHFLFSSITQRNAEIWRKAYENAVRWHGEHQTNFWRRAAENLERENQKLREQLKFQLKRIVKSIPGVYYETSDEEEDSNKKVISVKKEKPEEDQEVDVKYLEFLEITLKHREELQRKRQAEAQEVVDSPSVMAETTETPLA